MINLLIIDGFKIDFGPVVSDNYTEAAPLAGAAITDERLSLGVSSHIKSTATKIKPDNDPSEITVFYDSDAGFLFSYDPEYYTAFEPAIFSGKTLAEFSLSDYYHALRNDDLDWKKILLPNAKPFGENGIGKSKKSLFITPNKNQFCFSKNITSFQRSLFQWFKSGAPHRYSTHNWNYEESRVGERFYEWKGKFVSYPKLYWFRSFCVQPPILKSSGDSALFPISFEFVDENGFVVMRIDKLVLFSPYGLPTKIYLPLTNWGSDLLHPETGTLLKIPVPGKQPLYNLRDIQGASSVVLCASLDDAAGLKQANPHQTDVAFTSFVCDPGCYDEVNFTPLNGKKLYMLISNQSGHSIVEEYLTVNEAYEYLRSELDEKATFAFIHREVRYPDVGIAKSVDDVLTAYKSCPPIVRKCELVSETDFQRRVSAITSFKNQSWMTMGQCIEEDSTGNDRSKQLLVRPLLHRGK